MNYIEILTDAEKKNKYLMEILEMCDLFLSEPTRKDIDLIIDALKICYPFQIRNAIQQVSQKANKQGKIVNFAYVYTFLKKGYFGNRTTYKKDTNNKPQNNLVRKNRKDILKELGEF